MCSARTWMVPRRFIPIWSRDASVACAANSACPGSRLHDLGHLHATQRLGAGVPIRTVSGRLGHADAATTLNVYAHFFEASDRDAADVIGGLLDGQPVDE